MPGPQPDSSPEAAPHKASHSPRLQPAPRCGKAPRRSPPHAVGQAGHLATHEDQGRTRVPCPLGS